MSHRMRLCFLFKYLLKVTKGLDKRVSRVLFPAEAKITRIPAGASFNEAGLFYQSTYQLSGQVVTVKRVINAQRPGMVCQPQDYQLIRKLHPVVQRDVRAQVFYD